MDLGEHTLCLKANNLKHSIQFYQKLGFQMIEDRQEENWAVLRHNNLILSLFEGHLKQNLINFRRGDIQSIFEQASKNGLDFK